MLIHRKNWCRICGICLTCPRTKKSIFQQGDCHCPERQANHVPPKRVKGEKLFSFRYRHLSAEDIDILCELRPRFKFPTPPIERNLVRANICSTCQQRLRRARIFRRLNSSSKSKLDANNAVSDGSSDLNGDCSDRSGTAILRISNLIEAATLPQPPPHLLVSAMRSTLHRQVSQPCTSSQHSDKHSLWQHPMPASCSAADAVHCKLPAAQNEQPTDVESLEHNKKDDSHAAAAAHLWSLKSQTNLQVQNAAGSPSIGQRLGKQKDTCEQSDDDIDDLDTTHIDHDAYQNSGLKPYPVVLPVYSEDRSRANRSGQIVYGCSSRVGLPPNIEFRDASDSVLFVEHLSSDYSLEDVFYQYYPDAPQTLLFYVFGDVALPKKSTLNDIFSEFTVQELPVVVWVRMPVPFTPCLSPKWK